VSALDTPVRVPPSVVRRTFGDETIVLNLDSGQYHGLNDTATLILDRLETGALPRGVAAAIAAQAGVAVEVVERDVEALIEGLRSRGLVEVGDDVAG
jgi:hypothetical protein